MKKRIIFWIIIFCPISLLGYDVDSLVRNIRSEYNLMVNSKEVYKKTTLNINVYADDDENDDEIADVPHKEKTITYYVDEKNNQIKIISLYEAEIHFAITGKLTEYYLKNDSLFFIYQHAKEVSSDLSVPIEDRLTAAAEKRIYTTGDIDYFSTDKCAKYLFKSTEGKLSDMKYLLQKSNNTELDCSKSTENIYISAKDLVNIFYGRNEIVKVSKEEPRTYYYDILFGQ